MKEPAKIEKVTDDALSRSIISSVIGILLCMVCLVGTTWAWYSLSVESGVSETFGANFDFSVAVTKTDPPKENDAKGGTLQLSEAGVYEFNGGTYTVKLTKSGSCTATKGFCKLVATKTGEEAEATTTTTYYIVDFTKEEGTEQAEKCVEFTVKGSGKLMLIPMWGTPVETQGDLKDKIIELTPDPVATMLPPKPETQPDETGSPTDGEKGTPDETAEKQQQETPPAEEQQQQPVETPTNPETAEPGTPTESEQEPPAEPPVNIETTEPVTVPET